MNNKSFIAAALAIFFTLSLKAQFHVGVKAGVNAAKIEGKSFKEAFQYSYLAGGFAEISIGEKWSINPEVLFSQTTASTDTSFTNTIPDLNDEQLKVKLNYLSIPLLLNFRVLGPLHIEAGPRFGIIINNEKKLLENGEEAFKKGDFSIVGGAAININMLRFSARYVVGLSNISELPNQDKWKNQALQFSIGLAF